MKMLPSARVRAESQTAGCPAGHFSKSARSGAPSVCFGRRSKTARVIFSTLMWPTLYNRVGMADVEPPRLSASVMGVIGPFCPGLTVNVSFGSYVIVLVCVAAPKKLV